MNSSFFVTIFILIILICCFFLPFYEIYPEHFSIENSFTQETISPFSISSDYIWPVPGYTKITSAFGKRNSPTAGASSYHLGIDIGAPAHANLVAICSGSIGFVGFKGANGYMITLISSQEEYTISYCHVAPSILVSTGDFVTKGDVIRICWAQKCIWSCQ